VGGAPEGRGVVGTPGYVAPEEVARGGAAVGPAADVYGTAAVGYAMLTGAPPVGGGDVLDVLARAGRPPTTPRELGVAVPEALEGALLGALHHDPARRPDAASFVRALAFADASLAVGGAA
jgi:serine/threonine protein kinase